QAHAITAGVNATTSGKGAKATVEGFFIHGRLREGIRHGQYGQGRNEDQLKFADSLPQAKSKLAEVSHRSNPLYWLWWDGAAHRRELKCQAGAAAVVPQAFHWLDKLPVAAR